MTVLVIADVGVSTASSAQFKNSSVNANSDGTLTIDSRDLVSAMAAGYVPARRETRQHEPMVTAPAAAAVGTIVASVALTNTTLTVAANPDVMREVSMRVDPGASAITAGVCTVTYAANDGTAAQVDVLSLVAAASTAVKTSLTKGAVTVTSAITSGLVGGSSPKVQLDITAKLAVPVPLNNAAVTILKEVTDGADSGAVGGATLGTITATGIWTPRTAPNGTHSYAVAYTTISP